MGLKSTTVSVQGDREYIHILKAVAARHKITLASLTRTALDTQYGDEIEKMKSLFFEDIVASKQRQKQTRNGVKREATNE